MIEALTGLFGRGTAGTIDIKTNGTNKRQARRMGKKYTKGMRYRSTTRNVVTGGLKLATGVTFAKKVVDTGRRADERSSATYYARVNALYQDAKIKEQAIIREYRTIRKNQDDLIAKIAETNPDLAERLRSKQDAEMENAMLALADPISVDDIMLALQNYDTKFGFDFDSDSVTDAQLAGITVELQKVLESKKRDIRIGDNFTEVLKKKLSTAGVVTVIDGEEVGDLDTDGASAGSSSGGTGTTSRGNKTGANGKNTGKKTGNQKADAASTPEQEAVYDSTYGTGDGTLHATGEVDESSDRLSSGRIDDSEKGSGRTPVIASNEPSASGNLGVASNEPVRDEGVIGNESMPGRQSSSAFDTAGTSRSADRARGETLKERLRSAEMRGINPDDPNSSRNAPGQNGTGGVDALVKAIRETGKTQGAVKVDSEVSQEMLHPLMLKLYDLESLNDRAEELGEKPIYDVDEIIRKLKNV